MAKMGTGRASRGRATRTTAVGTRRFDDRFDDYLAFLGPRLVEAYRVLAPHGSFYLHVDYREVHHCRLFLDDLFGPDHLLNEIIWAYDYGARPKTRWPAKHDNILFYVKDLSNYVFNVDEIERIPYMAPGAGGAGEGCAREAPHGHVVAHDRPHERRGEDAASSPRRPPDRRSRLESCAASSRPHRTPRRRAPPRAGSRAAVPERFTSPAASARHLPAWP